MIAKLLSYRPMVWSFRSLSTETPQMSIHRELFQNQVQQCTDSPLHLLELYKHKHDLLDPHEKLLIFTQLTDLLYSLKNSNKMQRHGYGFWIEVVKHDKNFHKLMEELGKSIKELEGNELATMCNLLWYFRIDWCFCKLSLWHKEVFKSMQREVMKLEEREIGIESLAMLVWGFAKLKRNDYKFSKFLSDCAKYKMNDIMTCKTQDFLPYSILMSSLYSLNPETNKVPIKGINEGFVTRIKEVPVGVLSGLTSKVAEMKQFEDRNDTLKAIIQELPNRDINDMIPHNFYIICKGIHQSKSLFVSDELTSFIIKGIKKVPEGNNIRLYIEALSLFLNPEPLSQIKMKQLRKAIGMIEGGIGGMNHRDCVAGTWGLCKIYNKVVEDKETSNWIKSCIMKVARTAVIRMKNIDRPGAHIIDNAMRSVKLQNTELDMALRAKFSGYYRK